MSHIYLRDRQVQQPMSPPGQEFFPGGATSPLTESQHIEVVEEFPTSWLVDCYQQDLGLDVALEFPEVKRLQLCRCLDSDVMFFYPTVSGSSQFYEQLQNFHWYYQTEKFEYRCAANWIQTGDRVLDIGCGSAHFAQYIPTASYYGLEPLFYPAANGMKKGLHVVTEGISKHAKDHSQAYDAVCAFQVLEHVRRPRTFLTSALSCLKPGGYLILGVPSADSYITKIPNFVLNAPPHHLTWWTDRALSHLAEQFQLSILDLVHAPVESWETRLYWMQRIISMFTPHEGSRFTASSSRRFLNRAAYLLAGCFSSIVKPSVEAQGSSVVMIAKKVKE